MMWDDESAERARKAEVERRWREAVRKQQKDEGIYPGSGRHEGGYGGGNGSLCLIGFVVSLTRVMRMLTLRGGRR